MADDADLLGEGVRSTGARGLRELSATRGGSLHGIAIGSTQDCDARKGICRCPWARTATAPASARHRRALTATPVAAARGPTAPRVETGATNACAACGHSGGSEGHGCGQRMPYG